jgi:hypothetical protein
MFELIPKTPITIAGRPYEKYAKFPFLLKMEATSTMLKIWKKEVGPEKARRRELRLAAHMEREEKGGDVMEPLRVEGIPEDDADLDFDLWARSNMLSVCLLGPMLDMIFVPVGDTPPLSEVASVEELDPADETLIMEAVRDFGSAVTGITPRQEKLEESTKTEEGEPVTAEVETE